MSKRGKHNSKIITNATLLRIKQIIAEHENGSVADFANTVRLTPSHYYSWVKRDTAPGIATLKKICEAYNCTMDWLTGESDTSAAHKPAAGSTSNSDVDKKGSPLLTVLESALRDSENKTRAINGLVESTKTMAKSTETLADSNKTISETNKKLASTNEKLSYLIKKRDTNP